MNITPAVRARVAAALGFDVDDARFDQALVEFPELFPLATLDLESVLGRLELGDDLDSLRIAYAAAEASVG